MKFGGITLDNNLFLAPLAGITDTIFRAIAKRYGCGLVFSEMINSNGILRGGISLTQKLDISSEEGKVGIQIAGDDPDILSQAAQMAVDAGAVTININMGCPAKQITRHRAGCALMTDPHLVRNIIRRVKKAIDVPLSIKIRLGWDHQSMNYLEISKIAEEEGCAAIIMHARTRKDGFSGEAKWSEIKTLKEHRTIPVVGNGDVISPQRGLDMLEQTGCDGIMIGRGALGQPWIFRQLLDLKENRPPTVPTLKERKELILEHLKMSIERYGQGQGLKIMQKHFAWYSKGLPHSAPFRAALHAKKSSLNATVDFISDFFEKGEARISSIPSTLPNL